MLAVYIYNKLSISVSEFSNLQLHAYLDDFSIQSISSGKFDGNTFLKLNFPNWNNIYICIAKCKATFPAELITLLCWKNFAFV